MKRPFDRVIAKQIDDLPDGVLEVINALVKRILLAATIVNNEMIDPNLSLGAMEKALCLLIARFFKEDQIEGVIDQVHAMMKENVNLWKCKHEEKAHDNND